jgi:DNA invertase Pin-like site-specific DNA recombinase
MHDVGKRFVDCVIVWKYDRFARSLSVLISALQQFSALGVDFISYTQNIDTTTPMGRLFYHVTSLVDRADRTLNTDVIAEQWTGWGNSMPRWNRAIPPPRWRC